MCRKIIGLQKSTRKGHHHMTSYLSICIHYLVLLLLLLLKPLLSLLVLGLLLLNVGLLIKQHNKNDFELIDWSRLYHMWQAFDWYSSNSLLLLVIDLLHHQVVINRPQTPYVFITSWLLLYITNITYLGNRFKSNIPIKS